MLLHRTFIIPDTEQILTAPLAPTNWMIEQFLSVGDIAILAGPGYSGKSWIVADLAACWATGRSALGWAPRFKPLKVLWIDEENPTEENWLRLRDITSALNIHHEELEGQLIHPITRAGFNSRDPGWTKALAELVKEENPDWIFFDSLTRVAKMANENDVADSNRFYHEFLVPLNDNGRRGIILVHHLRKPSEIALQEGWKPSGAQLRGSSDIYNMADSVLICWRDHGSTFVMSDKARRDAHRGEHPPPTLKLNLVSGRFGEGRRPCVVETLEEENAAPKGLNDQIVKAIVESVECSFRPLTIDNIFTRCEQHLGRELQRITIKNRVSELVQAGVLKKELSNIPGGNGQPTPIFSLNDNSASQDPQ